MFAQPPFMVDVHARQRNVVLEEILLAAVWRWVAIEQLLVRPTYISTTTCLPTDKSESILLSLQFIFEMGIVPVRLIVIGVTKSTEISVLQPAHFPKKLDNGQRASVFLTISISPCLHHIWEIPKTPPHHQNCPTVPPPFTSFTINLDRYHRSEYLTRPRGKITPFSGLNFTSRIFALLGEIVVRIRDHHRRVNLQLPGSKNPRPFIRGS